MGDRAHADTPAAEGRREPDLLRFTTAGSVDDGKSTLIGRLLHDSHALFDDQMAALEKLSDEDRDAFRRGCTGPCPSKWCKSISARQDAEGKARRALPVAACRAAATVPAGGGHRGPG